MADLWTLFQAFMCIGCFTFGGSYAMLQKEIVEKLNQATESEIMDYFAVGQCPLSVITVNTATFVGYIRKVAIRGIIATLCLSYLPL